MTSTHRCYVRFHKDTHDEWLVARMESEGGTMQPIEIARIRGSLFSGPEDLLLGVFGDAIENIWRLSLERMIEQEKAKRQ